MNSPNIQLFLSALLQMTHTYMTQDFWGAPSAGVGPFVQPLKSIII